MDSYELNKVLGALLGTCLIVLSLNITAGAIFSPATPKKPGYEIAIPEKAGPTPAGPAAPEEPIEKLLAAADIARGEQAIKPCVACHTFDKGGANRVGPNLWNIVGRAKAAVAGFNYSAAMKAKGGNWSLEELNTYLLNPKAMVPGTNMVFAGIPRPATRADVIAYLNSRADNPAPLPKAAEASPAPPPAAATPAQTPAAPTETPPAPAETPPAPAAAPSAPAEPKPQ
jgi:cytochrome c